MVEEARLWLAYSMKAWLPAGELAPIPSRDEQKALSYFRLNLPENSTSPSGADEGFMEPIEPLSGVARHPFARVGCAHTPDNSHDVDIYNIQYLIIHNNCGKLPKPKTFLFDMGASVGFYGIPGGLYQTMPITGGGLDPSLPLFYRLYQDRCLEPDEIHAWEPNTHLKSDQDFYGELPAHVRAKV